MNGSDIDGFCPTAHVLSCWDILSLLMVILNSAKYSYPRICPNFQNTKGVQKSWTMP